MNETATRTRPVTREDVVRILRREGARLRSQGVLHLALFGSLARGDAGPESDIDLVADLHDDFSLLDHVGVMQELSDLLGRKVDLVARDAMKGRMATEIAEDELRIF